MKATAYRPAGIDTRPESELVASVERWICKRANYYVRRYRLSDDQRDDLESEGRIGAIHAARRYEPERGIAFLTIADYWIRQSMSRYVRQQATVIRVPEGKHRAGKVYDDSTLTGAVLNRALRCVPVTSLDAPIRMGDEGDTGTLMDLIPADAPDEDEARTSQEVADLYRAIDNLNDRRIRDVLTLRAKGLTLTEVGQRIRSSQTKKPLTRERARQLEAIGIAVLRSAMRGTK